MSLGNSWRRLWNDEDGFIVSLELVITSVMLVFGLVAGLQVLRDATILELVDLGNAIGALNNSFVGGGGGGGGPTFTVTLGVPAVPE